MSPLNVCIQIDQDPFFRVRNLLIGFGELPLGLGELLRLVRDSPIAFGKLAPKAIVFPLQVFRIRAIPLVRPRHASHGTPIAAVCTGP
jgi:hypothetical protein